jgi:malonyl-CoA O-methyltransferase
MRELLPDLHTMRVLDAACGSGRYTRIAHAHGADRVISLDNSSAMLQQVQSPLRVCGSLNALPFAPQSIDVILCGLAVGHVSQLAPVLNDFARVLVPGGHALLSDFHPFQALNGAQRTFTVNGITRAVEHHVHLYSAYQQAADAAGLQIDAIREPGLPGSDRKAPVVLVLRLIKRG